MTDSDTDRDPLDILAEDFTERCRRGEHPSVSDYVARYPHLAADIRTLLPPVAMMEQLRRKKQAEVVGDRQARPLERVGDYRIVSEIGRGGMGIVYEATQESLGRRVALKVLPQHALLNPKKLERFEREARAAARLHHTNIVPVFGVGEYDGLHYYVMQLIEGQGLHEVIANLREEAAHAVGCPMERAARMILQAAEALDYAHRQGTLHRDIKPANLLVDHQDAVWITDFGVAKAIGAAAGSEGGGQGQLTDTGDLVGTMQYMAPECYQGHADARSDVYSLGLTLYELLTLEPPYTESNPAMLLKQISERDPLRPRLVNPAIPRDLETIVLKAIAREPGHRYQTAKALAEDLECFLADRPIQARRITPLEHAWRWGRRNRALAGLTATALLSLLLAIVAGWTGYARTRLALEGEARKSAEAEAASRRAEENVNLSLQAFEEIFNNRVIQDLTPPDRLAFLDPAVARRRAPGPPPAGPRLGAVGEDAALLHSVLMFYDQFAERNATNSRLQKEAAKAHRRVGDLQQWLGQSVKADAAYRRAAAIYERLAVDFPMVPEYRYELMETYARSRPASTDREVLREMESRLLHARALGEELIQAPAAPPAYTASLARALCKLGSVLQQQDRAQEAETTYREALRLLDSLTMRPPPLTSLPQDRAMARYLLANLLLQKDRPQQARPLLETAIADLETRLPTAPGFRMASPLRTALYQSLAIVWKRLGQPAQAAEAARKAEQLAQRPPFPPGPPESGRPGRMPPDRP
jgi:tetratricopeptide (TPR) repeat protein